jgi:hypothetical protein
MNEEMLINLWLNADPEIILEAGKKAGKLLRGDVETRCGCCGPELFENEYGDDWRIK